MKTVMKTTYARKFFTRKLQISSSNVVASQSAGIEKQLNAVLVKIIRHPVAVIIGVGADHCNVAANSRTTDASQV